MKRTLLASLLIMSVLFSGCSLFSQKEDVPQATEDEVTLEKKIGLVTSKESQNLATSPAAFLLLTESNELIPLEAASVNLKRYTKRRVEVEGKWNDTKTVFLVDSLVSLGQETQLKQNHKSGKLGLSFNFPSLWVLREEANLTGVQKIVITPYEVSPEEEALVDTFTIEKTENNKKLPVREWLGLDEQYREPGAETTVTVYQESKIGVLQSDAVKKTVSNGETVAFYVGRDNVIYVFSHATKGDSDRDMYRNAFYDFVQSFEFIPFSDVTVTTPPANPPAIKNETTLGEDEAKKKALEALAKQNEMEDIYVDYIKENITKLAPEAAKVGGTWSVTSIEFVAPEDKPRDFFAVYVTYEDGHDMRKMLFLVTDPIAPSTMKREAYFIPGGATDWQLKEGVDTGKSGQKTVYEVNNGTLQQVTVKKGMTLLEAKSLKVKIQYPSSWYWAFGDGKYSFSTKPVTKENTLLSLEKNNPQAADAMAVNGIGEIAGRHATESLTGPGNEPDGLFRVCVNSSKVEADRFCLAGDESLKDTMKQMLETLTE